MTHDLIVIGAGPAGSAAAFTAARAGLRVALIDKAEFPREKLCGGGFTGRSRHYLREIFGLDVDRPGFLRCDRLRLTEGPRTLADLPGAPPIWMTLRRELDALLLETAAGAGCTLLTGRRISSMEPAAGQVTLADGTRLSAPALIGADGANSATARTLFGRAFDPSQIGFALEVERPANQDQPGEVVEIDLGAAEWGYGWAFPKGRQVTLGIGGVHRRNPRLREAFEGFAVRHGADLGRLRCKGAFLPFGEVRDVPGQGRALLAGDAAGLVDPITGEGIAWAMKSGALAAAAVAAAQASGEPATALRRYCETLRPIQSELRRARALRWLAYQPRLRPAFLRMLAAESGLQRRYLALLAGEMDYADLGWNALPRLGWRLLRRAARPAG